MNNMEAPGSSTVVMITYTLNEIRHNYPYEQRVVTVTETFGDGEQLVGEHYYLIKNLAIRPVLHHTREHHYDLPRAVKGSSSRKGRRRPTGIT